MRRLENGIFDGFSATAGTVTEVAREDCSTSLANLRQTQIMKIDVVGHVLGVMITSALDNFICLPQLENRNLKFTFSIEGRSN